MKKRILSLILTLCMLLGLAPTAALAAGDAAVDVGGVTLANDEYYKIDDNGAPKIDGTADDYNVHLSNGVLTLKDADIQVAAGENFGIHSTAALELVLEGENTISFESTSDKYAGVSAGDDSSGPQALTIRGSGSLGMGKSSGSVGVFLNGGAITVKSGTILAEGLLSGIQGVSLTVEGGTLTAKAMGGKMSGMSVGIGCWLLQGDLTISGGTVTAIAPTGDYGEYSGVMIDIDGDGSVQINGGSLNVTGTRGIAPMGGGGVNVNGGELTVASTFRAIMGDPFGSDDPPLTVAQGLAVYEGDDADSAAVDSDKDYTAGLATESKYIRVEAAPAEGDTTTVKPGGSVTKGGVTVTNSSDDGIVTITDGKDNTTTVTLPEKGDVTVDNTTGEVTVPGGSTVGTTPAMTLPEGGGVKPDGTVTVPEDGTVTITDGADTTTITPPTGGEVTPDGEGGVHVDKGTTVRTGNGPVITLPETGEGGTVQPGGTVSGSPVQVGGTTVDVSATDPAQGDITTDKDGNVTLPGGTTAKVDDGQGSETTVTVPDGQGGSTGGSATVKPDGGIDLPAGGSVTQGDTTVTVPEGGGTVGKDVQGSLTVPDGSTVQTGTGTEITVGPGNGGTVDPTTGGVTVPAGGKVSIPDGKSGKTEITVPSGGEVKPGTDGGVEAPGGSTVKKPDGTTGTVPAGGGAVKPDGSVEGDTPAPDDGKLDSGESITVTGGTVQREGDTVTLTDQNGTTTVTVPAGGEVTVDKTTGQVTVPAGSTLDTDPVITLPSGGIVTPHGAIIGNPVQVGDSTVTAPDGFTVDANKDGRVNVPNGGTVQTTGDNPTITMPEGGTMWANGNVFGNPVKVNDVTVTPGGGLGIEVPPSGVITLPGDTEATVEKGGVTATVTTPYGSTTTVQPGGQVELPKGGTITTGDTTITIGAGGSTVTPGSGEVPGGATVQTGDTTPITVGNEGGTVDKDGTVTVPAGGSVTITDGTNTSTITLPDGGAVKPREDGGINVPGGSEVTKPDGTTETVPEGGAIVYPDGTIKTGDTPTPPTPKTFTVTFDAMGGSKVASQTVTEGKTAKEPNAPAKNGYTFLGWTTDKAGATTYDFSTPVTANITLYAQWKKTHAKTYTVTFNPQGGEPAPEAQTVEAGKLVTKPDAPTKSGYDFQGWFQEAEGTTPWQFNVYTVSKDTTLYAVWKEVKPGTAVTPDDPVELPDGGSVVKDPDTGDVTITTGGEGGSTTTVTPGEGDVTVDDEGNVTVPGGSQVTTPGGSTVDLPDGGKVDGEGNITLPDGGSVVTVPDGEGGSTAITAPDGGGTLKATEDGSIEVPGGSTVKSGENGPEITVPDQGGTVDPGTGGVTVPGGSTVTIPDGTGGKTEITVPAGGNSTIKPTGGGKVGVPQGSEVKTNDGTKIAVTTGTDAVVKPDGTVTIPGGGIVTVTTPDGKTQTVNVPVGGTVDPSSPITPPSPSGGGGGGGGGGSSTYAPTIRQPEHGKISISPAKPERGDKVTVTVKPDSGYTVETITVTDKNGKAVAVTKNADGTYTFTQPSGKVTISASLKATGSVSCADCPRDETCPIWPYTDASVTAWYHDGVHYCIDNGLMNGYGSGLFGPDKNLSRAMLAQILYNQAGRPVVSGSGSFDDVAENAWYAQAVTWAAAQGIVSGYGDGRFGPDNNITREQLATMLYRYEQKRGGGFTGSWMFLLDFTDADQVSGWADEAMHWMVMNKIVTGKGNGILDPKGQATRAEAATMLQRFLTGTEK